MNGEIHQQNGVTHDDTRQGNPTYHGGRGELTTQSQGKENGMHGNNAQQGQGDGRHDERGNAEVAEFPNHQNVDQHQGRTKGHAHVTEGLVSDRPFTGPLEGGAGVGGRRPRPVGMFRQFHAIGSHVGFSILPALEQVFHLHHAVHGCRQTTAHVGDHVFHGAQILVEHGGFHRHALEFTQFTQGHAHAVLGLNQQITQAGDLGTLCQGHLDHDIHGLMTGALFHVSKHHTPQGHGQVLVDGIHGNAPHIGLLAVHHEAPVIMGLDHVIVHVLQVGRLLEDLSQVRRHLAARRRIRPVYRRHHGLQHRRPRRHLHHGKPGIHVLEQLGDPCAGIHGDFVTAALAVMLVHQLHLYLRLPRFPAQVVMAHHAVEIEGLGRTHVHLHRCHFRQLAHQVGHLVGPVGRLRQGGSLGHVQHHGKLGFVVQGQHFHYHQLEIEHGAHEQEHTPHGQAEAPRLARILNHGHENAPVHLFQFLRFPVLTLLRHSQVFHGRPEYGMNSQPGGKYKGGEQGDDHGHGTQGGNGHHVGPHHAGHEAHGQQCTDNRQGGQNGGIAYLAHGVHGGFRIGLALLQPATVDVFHHHDGVIHQDTNGEYQGEQGYPVDGEAQHPGAENREQQHHGNDQQHHDGGLQGTEGPPYQNEHKEGGHEQLEDQGADLVISRLAIVAGNTDLHVAGNQPALELLYPFQHLVGHRHTIGALLLGDGDGHRRHTDGQVRVFRCRTRVIGHHLLGVFRPLTYQGHVTHVYRHAIVAAHLEMIDVVRGLQELAGNHRKVGTAGFHVARLLLHVGLLYGLGHLPQADAVTGQPFRQHFYGHLLGAAAHHKAFPGIRNLLDGLQHGQGQAAQLTVVHVRDTIPIEILVRPQGQGDHGHVVYALGLHQGRRHTVGNLVHVGGQLFVDLHQGGLHLLAHLKLHGYHAATALRHGIHVFHALDLPHHALQGLDGQGGHFLHGSAGIPDEQVDEGNGNLRIFLPRRHDQASQAQQEHGDIQQGRQGGIDEEARRTPRDPEIL